jgi:hypothetical protein
MKKLAAFDLVILGYIGIVTAIVLAFRPEGTLLYFAYHVAAVAFIALLVYAYERFGGPAWTFARYWYVVLLSAAAFREMHYLIPQVHPFDDHHYDRVLQGLDLRWFGDVDRFFLASPLFVVDLLHLCYWFYFLSTLILGAAIYARKDWKGLREYLVVVMAGLMVSYLGYFAVPAIGPHHFYHPRPAPLDGLLLGKWLHEGIVALEWRMPDAFPSGHALLSMIVIVMSWRLHRPTFRVVVGPAAGCVVATMALRYHYVVDVAASMAILPAVVCGGLALNRWRDRTVKVPASQEP